MSHPIDKPSSVFEGSAAPCEAEFKNTEKLREFKGKIKSIYFERYLQEPPCKIKNCLACSAAIL